MPNMRTVTMTADAGGAGAGAGGEGASEAGRADEGKEKAAPPAAEEGKAPTYDEATLKAVQFHADMNARYRSDPVFKARFDALVRGEDAGDGNGTGRETSGEPSGKSKDALKIEEQLGALTKEIETLKNREVVKETISNRSDINAGYYKIFDGLAHDAGFEAGSKDYAVLFRSASEIAKQLCPKYKLVDESGAPDTLKRYEPELIKEAFKIAHDDLKEIGYDPEARREKIRAERQRAAQEKEESRLNDILSKDKLKTAEGRAAALKKALFYNLKKQGVDVNKLKLV